MDSFKYQVNYLVVQVLRVFVIGYSDTE